MERALYQSLAALLSYPGDDDHRRLAGALAAIAGRPAPVAAELSAFAALMAAMTLPQRQELYIQTFDLNPVCSLEMGWHLFGENYDRGLLLVKMRQQLRAHGLAETTELPDHLSHGLRLLARMDEDAAAYFAEAILLPAVEKMLPALAGKDNPYEHLLRSVRLALRADFPGIPAQLTVPGNQPDLRILA